MYQLSTLYKSIADFFVVLTGIFLWTSIGAVVSAYFNPNFDHTLSLSLLILGVVHIIVALVFHYKYRKQLKRENKLLGIPVKTKGRHK